MSSLIKKSRRDFLKSSGVAFGSVALPSSIYKASHASPAIITLDGSRPQLEQGLQMGDVSTRKAVIWSRADRPSRMYVEYSLNEDFSQSVRVPGPYALETTDYTAHLDLSNLPTDSELFVRAQFQDLSNERVSSDYVTGVFRTAPEGKRDLRFLWSGDTAGQGWGINPDFGGMRIFESMRQTHPDFFIHCGDTIYADGPIEEQQEAEDGEIWRNIVTPEVSKVAETMDEFRGRYKYNLLDENVRGFNAEVPQIWQMDDHEVLNNWSDSKVLLDDERYTEKNVPLLAARGIRAFLEYSPAVQLDNVEGDRIYRKVSYGELLDVFVLDMRSYRAANSHNRQEAPGEETVYMGKAQIDWLKRNLKNSKATWKVIASDMPLGLVVGDGEDAEGRPRAENSANGDGPVLGREFEIADLLGFIKRKGIENIVWFTADVHYCAAHYYDPNKAQYQDFSPFWEFVSGPLNAGSFRNPGLDNTFGPQIIFEKEPSIENLSPFGGLQFFGQVDIEAATSIMTVHLKDIDGNTLFTQSLEPELV